jgi:hypothetical protein
MWLISSTFTAFFPMVLVMACCKYWKFCMVSAGNVAYAPAGFTWWLCHCNWWDSQCTRICWSCL